jgi:hypothetical protein
MLSATKQPLSPTFSDALKAARTPQKTTHQPKNGKQELLIGFHLSGAHINPYFHVSFLMVC